MNNKPVYESVPAPAPSLYKQQVGSHWVPLLPQWVIDELQDVLKFMKECENSPSLLAFIKSQEGGSFSAEWNSIYDRIAYILDPNYNDGWESEDVKVQLKG